MLQLYSYIPCTFPVSCTVSQSSEYIAAIHSSVMLSAIAEGLGSEHFKYHWGKMNNYLPSTVSGQGTPNLVIAPVTLFDHGFYYCNVTNQWGNTCRSNIASVKVLSKCVH